MTSRTTPRNKKPARSAPASWQERDPNYQAEEQRYAEPVPSRDLILQELSQARKPLDANAVARRLGVK